MNANSQQPLRVAFLTNVISPYRRPVFQALAATPGWDLRVIVNAQTEFDRDWDGACEGVDVVQAKTWTIRRRRVSRGAVTCEQHVELHVPVGLWRELSKFAPDVVIGHELGPRSFLAAQWCRWHRKPFTVWSYQSRSSASVGGRLRSFVRNAILRQARTVIGMGKQAREVLQGFGVPAEKIVDAPNATDVQLVRDRLRSSQSDGTLAASRARYANGKRICLVAGRLEPVKNIAGILDMWSRLPQSLRDEWTLLFLGNGRLQPLIEQCDDPSVVHVPGVPMARVVDFFTISDLHLFASLADVWGLAVNEAMLAGVPTLCSTLAGCADDLITHGHNGLLFDPSQHEAACAALHDAMQRQDLRAIGEAARQTGNEFTIDRLADGFREAVRRSLPEQHAVLAAGN